MTAVMDSLAHLARAVGGRLVNGDASFNGVSTDTRKIMPADLYVALKGDRFDGHNFVMEAAQRGASCALVDREVAGGLPQVVVGDALDGLQRYAQHWRARFDIPVVGITGSNGKTTTKEMLAAILRERGPVLATIGNLNNHIGVPLTLTRLRAEHQNAIIEMGANHAGEIALLAKLARPTVGVVTQAGAAHLEGFGSREGVARAKGEMFAGLAKEGLAVINADDAYADLWRDFARRCRALTFGIEKPADVGATSIREIGEGIEFELVTPSGNAQVSLPLVGRHNVMNALAASACALGIGIDPATIARGLSNVQGVSGRLVPRKAHHGARLIDDTYNANPTSVKAAIELLARLPGKRWLALGDMGELGAEARAWHQRAGQWAREQNIDRLYTVGELSRQACDAFGVHARHFASHADLAEAIRGELDTNVTVLVKGSRSAQMEKVVAALLAPGEVSSDAHG